MSDYYTKEETDGRLADKADASTIYTRTEIDGKLATKADATALSSYYTKTQTDDLLADKADVSSLDAEKSARMNDVEWMQREIDLKQDKITGAATTITSDNLTASRVLVADSAGKVAVSEVTSTELSYMQGVTSNIQHSLDNKVETRNFADFVQTTEAGLSGKMPQISPLNSYVHARWNMAQPAAAEDANTLQFVPLIYGFYNVNSGTHRRWEYRAQYADGHTLEGSIIVKKSFASTYSGERARLVVTGGAPFVAYQNPQKTYMIDLYLEAGIDGDATNYLKAVDLWLPDPGVSYNYNIWDGTKTSETQWGYQSGAQGEYTYNDCPTLTLDFANLSTGYRAYYHPTTHSALLNYQIYKAYNMSLDEYYTKTQTDGLLERKEDALSVISNADIDDLIAAVCV